MPSHCIQGDADLIVRHLDRENVPELIIRGPKPARAMIGRHRVDAIAAHAPLAGIVALLGSWCEGETRASRPSHDVQRLYWYEFAPWWRRQLALRAAGHCPDWARPDAVGGHSQSATCSVLEYSILSTQRHPA